ncbi:hypothetical protein PSEUDO8Z_160052 [Pseudomonas sp. 8Z]|uniref:hypothetical protein n=1 Tax=Pseudomonas sp. 8Z TaxID=2653166 RepID=UPI0012F3D977|nr:hypothetical protein [Pseudomonas sp. 8Z]VXC65828.1 hypothetical protein PSEUDO8Z_160052 [Pseudomonas sp. 8Z]
MFALSKESADAQFIEGAANYYLVIWRWLSPNNHYKDSAGNCRAKSEAFDIRRNEDGTVKEPSASFFELNDAVVVDITTSSVQFFGFLPFKKDTLIGSAAAALKMRDVLELQKDPRFKLDSSSAQAFEIEKSLKQKKKGLTHWDFKYAGDDLLFRDLKVALANISECAEHVEFPLVGSEQ